MKLSLADKINIMFTEILAICPKIGRFLIKAFGLKLKYKNKIYLTRYWQAKENGENITTLPQIDGLIRKVQLANLAILKEFDSFCRENKLDYWLVYGTQLGETRHKGYIPWDDDIDVAMMRDDYEKLAEIFNKSVHNKDLILEVKYNKHTPCMLIMKILNKKLPFLFIDIFPCDYYYSALTPDKQTEVNEKLTSIRNRLNKDRKLLKLKKQEIYNYAKNIIKTEVLNNKSPNKNDKPDIFWGLDFPHGIKKRIYSYDDIFPLSDVDFETLRLKQMNKPLVHLEGSFGKNYMDYPDKIVLGHFQNQIISKKEYKLMKDFIKTLD